MIHVWSSFFGWPDGGVWSNLVASGLWVAPGFTVHHVLMRRHHTRTTDAQTAELKAYVDQAVAPAPRQEGNRP